MRAMLQEGYDRDFSAGITAASSLIGPIIPPSIPLVAYGVIAEESIGSLFLGGVIPGTLMAICFIIYVSYRARRGNYPSGAMAGIRELLVSFRNAFLPLMTPVIIIGGIYGGIFTPTEAAAVAAFYAMVLGLLFYREYGWRHLMREIRGTMIDTAVIMLVIAFTSAFGVVMIRGQVPDALATLITQITTDPTLLLFLFTILWMIVGCFMAETPAILILTPILLPTAEKFGIDPIHFGVVMTVALTIGLLTPPVGMVLYALIPVTELPFERLAVLAIPYILLSLIVVALTIVFPELVLWLPRMIMN